MDHAAIRLELVKRGLNYSRIANILDVSTTVVSQVSSRRRTSHRIAVAIAAALECSTAEVFPDVPAYHRPYMTAGEVDQAEQRLGEKLKHMRITGT